MEFKSRNSVMQLLDHDNMAVACQISTGLILMPNAHHVAEAILDLSSFGLSTIHLISGLQR